MNPTDVVISTSPWEAAPARTWIRAARNDGLDFLDFPFREWDIVGTHEAYKRFPDPCTVGLIWWHGNFWWIEYADGVISATPDKEET